jgi:hypothetical protein
VPWRSWCIAPITWEPSGSCSRRWAADSPDLPEREVLLQLREPDFETAALSLGAKEERILRVHLLPNFVSTLIVYASLYLACVTPSIHA